ncbi:MAG: cytochrome-c oxidase, cbb3-type subunit III [Pseudomonadota bacterium]
MSSNTEQDDVTGIETTGHEWDGIKELNNPLPRWWLWTFYATIVFAIGYTVAYPAWPLVSSSTSGLLNWSSRGNLANDIQSVADSRAALALDLTQVELTEVSDKPELMQFALAGGASAFRVNCSQCHGSGAAGGGIYPNLVDDDWLWGGSLDDIYITLLHGIRYAQDDDSRISDMPAFGDLLSRDEVNAVAAYVANLSAPSANATADTTGQTIFMDNCSVCHGEAGEGMIELGAPALNDAIWLYDGDVEQIAAQIRNPKMGVMPGWQGRLDDVTIRQLTLYVHSLGGGQ